MDSCSSATCAALGSMSRGTGAKRLEVLRCHCASAFRVDRWRFLYSLARPSPGRQAAHPLPLARLYPLVTLSTTDITACRAHPSVPPLPNPRAAQEERRLQSSAVVSPADRPVAMLPSAMRDRATIEAFADSVLKTATSPRSIAMVAGMANAQLPGGISPLMLATRHSDPDKAVKIVNLLLKHGAELKTRDERGRHALMYACEYGVSIRVIDCLLSWSKRLGNWALQWADRDCEGHDALVLAARAGHGQLASELLERIDLDSYPLENYPLAVLEAAIESQDESSATAVLQNSKIRREIESGGAQARKTRLVWQRTCNLSTCVQAAVCAQMTELVDGMLELNDAAVKRATWYAIYEAKLAGSDVGCAKLRRIADSYRHERLWDEVKTVAPLRRCSLLKESEAQLSVWERVRRRVVHGVRDWDAMEEHPLATIPNDVFASIMGFVGPSEEEEAREIRRENEVRRCLECKIVCIPGECNCRHRTQVVAGLEDDLELW